MPNGEETEPPPPSRLAGCLGEFVGEGLFYLAAAVLAGFLVLIARGFDVLSQRHPAIGLGALTVLALAFLYGLVWTVRVRPGLYLENLRDDGDRQKALGETHRRLRIAGMIYLQVACLAVAGYVITVVVWSRP